VNVANGEEVLSEGKCNEVKKYNSVICLLC
jgi:hypothetical protein